MLSYPSLTAIFRWLPFKLRMTLVRYSKSPHLKRVDERISYHFNEVYMESMPLLMYFVVDTFTFRVKTNPMGVIQEVTRTEDVGGHVDVVAIKESANLTRDDFSRRMFDRYLNRPCNTIGTLRLGPDRVFYALLKGDEAARKVWNATKVHILETDGYNGPRDFCFASAWRHIHDMLWHDIYFENNFVAMIQMYASQKRPIGSEMEVAVYSQSTATVRLQRVLADCHFMKPKRGVVPRHLFDFQNDVEGCVWRDVFIERATRLQCVVFEAEHADFVVLHNAIKVGLDAHPFYTFRVVPKKTVSICEPDEWLTKFECDGAVSYVDMSH